MNDPEVYRVGMMTCNDVNPIDTANTFESEGLLDYMYALISVGEDLSPIAQDLLIPSHKLKLMMKSTPDRRKRYMEAKLSELSDHSIETLAKFKHSTGMDTEENNAAKHHKSILDSATKLMVTSETADSGPKVIVNNNTTIVGKDTPPPPLPAELEGIVIDVSPEP